MKRKNIFEKLVRLVAIVVLLGTVVLAILGKMAWWPWAVILVVLALVLLGITFIPVKDEGAGEVHDDVDEQPDEEQVRVLRQPTSLREARKARKEIEERCDEKVDELIELNFKRREAEECEDRLQRRRNRTLRFMESLEDDSDEGGDI